MNVGIAKKFKSSVFLSIFKRKGGESLLTKIITPDNSLYNLNFKDAEEALILFESNNCYKLIFTNLGIHITENALNSYIPYDELIYAGVGLKDEFADGIKNKMDFTRLTLQTFNEQYTLTLEKGEPYRGLLQMLNYIVRARK